MIRVTFDSSDVQNAINKIVDFLDGDSLSEDMFSDIANVMEEDVMDHFKKEEGSGGKWKSLEPSTLFKRSNKLGRPVKDVGKAVQKYTTALLGGSKILQDTGKLKNSIQKSKRNTESMAQLSTNRAGAFINNFGGILKIPELIPKNKRAMRFLKTVGGVSMVEWMFSKRVKAHDVSIPQRDFFWLSKKAKDSVADIVFKYIDKIWGEK